MAKILFKGIQQVTMDTFNSVEDKKGYLWFVREPQGENTGLGDDKFHIFFGTRCYGSFWEGEHEAMAASLNAIRVAVGLDENFAFAFEGATSVADAFVKVKGWYDALALEVADKADKADLAAFVADVDYADSKIIFKNAEGEELASVDAAPFIKDGMLSDVEIYTATAEDENLVADEKYIKFTWNTDGEEKVDYILASEIGATYTGSDSIEISEGNVISLKSADAELVQVGEIPVGGTPLANLLLENDITSISAGNLQAVLEALFSQNNWAENPRRIVPTGLTVSMSAPSISFDKTGTVEVGQSINVTASAKTASASASITYSGFTYGYSVANDNSKDGDTPSSVSVKGSVAEGSDYALTFVTNNGFGGVDIADVAGNELTGSTLVAVEGSNKVTVTAKSPKFTATVPAQDAIYACSSLKKTDEEHVVAASTATTIEGAVKSVTANTSVTGAYKLYVGYTDAAVADSDDIKKLATYTGWTNGTTAVSFGGGSFPAGKVSNIAMPSAWSLKEIKNGMDLVITNNFAKVDTIKYVLPNGDEVDYKVYSNLYSADVAYNSIKIGK